MLRIKWKGSAHNPRGVLPLSPVSCLHRLYSPNFKLKLKMDQRLQCGVSISGILYIVGGEGTVGEGQRATHHAASGRWESPGRIPGPAQIPGALACSRSQGRRQRRCSGSQTGGSAAEWSGPASWNTHTHSNISHVFMGSVC